MGAQLLFLEEWRDCCSLIFGALEAKIGLLHLYPLWYKSSNPPNNPSPKPQLRSSLKPQPTQTVPNTIPLRGPSFFFVGDPPKPTMRAPEKHHAVRHWSGAWVCWFRCGSLGLLGFVDLSGCCVWLLEKKLFDCRRKKYWNRVYCMLVS